MSAKPKANVTNPLLMFDSVSKPTPIASLRIPRVEKWCCGVRRARNSEHRYCNTSADAAGASSRCKPLKAKTNEESTTWKLLLSPMYASKPGHYRQTLAAERRSNCGLSCTACGCRDSFPLKPAQIADSLGRAWVGRADA
jgi:hypothetical protein